jgi:hypothetical protein
MLIFDPARFSVWCFFAGLSSLVVYLFVASQEAYSSTHAARGAFAGQD